MKTSHRCPKCQHPEILYIAHVADRYGEHAQSKAAVPMKLAYYQKSMGSLFGMAITTSETSGELSAGLCPSCGYTEFYTRDPQNIVVDGVNVQRLTAKPTLG